MSLDAASQRLLDELAAALQPDSLPPTLPLRDSANPGHYGLFLDFTLDDDLMEIIEDEVGVINEQFKRIFGWKSRTTGDQIVPITERGTPLSAVVDVLHKYLLLHPGNAVLLKWAADIKAGAMKAANSYQVSKYDHSDASYY